MRLLFVALLLVGIVGSSCEKYRLKQPAYLGFGWNFFDQQSGDHKAVVTGGFFYLNEFKVSGTRQEGPPVDIVQSLPVGKTTFSSGGDLGLTMDIPVGDYTEFHVDLSVIDEEQPCLVLYGEYDKGEITVPFRVEWKQSSILTFVSEIPFELKKKKDYKVTIGVNVQQLFSTLTQEDWQKASTTLEPGGPMIIIRFNNNNHMFQEIDHNLATALKIEVSQ